MNEEDLYDRAFFAMHVPWQAEYNVIADALVHHLAFSSVIDFGCGTGFLIARLAAHGKRVTGVERSARALEFMPECVRQVVMISDLSIPTDFGRHQLVICSEVAEHLPPWQADLLVETICRAAASWAFFTAAVLGQGGYGHINEQSPEYWLAKFARHKLHLNRPATTSLRAQLAWELHTCWWFARQGTWFGPPRASNTLGGFHVRSWNEADQPAEQKPFRCASDHGSIGCWISTSRL
jgi:SAM-dependent methyltransferase